MLPHFVNPARNFTAIPNKASALCILMYFIRDVTVQSRSQHQRHKLALCF